MISDYQFIEHILAAIQKIYDVIPETEEEFLVTKTSFKKLIGTLGGLAFSLFLA